MPPLPLAPGQTLPLRVDRQAFTGRGSGGLLLLVHTNSTGSRATAVPVVFADCSLEPCPTVTTSVAPATRSVTLSAAAPPACSPVSYEWDFGDGSPVATGSTVTHAYSRARHLHLAPDRAGGRPGLHLQRDGHARRRDPPPPAAELTPDSLEPPVDASRIRADDRGDRNRATSAS